MQNAYLLYVMYHWCIQHMCVCVCVCVCTLSCFSCVQLFVTLWTIACQALLFMECSRQEYWSGLPLPSPGDLPNPGIKPVSLVSPASAGRLFTTAPPGKPWYIYIYVQLFVTPWTAADQVSLSFPTSRTLLKLMSHWVGDATQPSRPLLPFLLLPYIMATSFFLLVTLKRKTCGGGQKKMDFGYKVVKHGEWIFFEYFSSPLWLCRDWCCIWNTLTQKCYIFHSGLW